VTFLDGPLYFLENPRPGIIDPALLRSGDRRAALLFTRSEIAQSHLAALPPGAAVGCADDLRAKEELLRAARARGATELWLDTAAGGDPATRYPLQRALDYVVSFKRQSACL
jgi:hypothetical protein